MRTYDALVKIDGKWAVHREDFQPIESEYSGCTIERVVFLKPPEILTPEEEEEEGECTVSFLKRKNIPFSTLDELINLAG